MGPDPKLFHVYMENSQAAKSGPAHSCRARAGLRKAQSGRERYEAGALPVNDERF